MQIMPTNRSDSASGVFFGADVSADSDFMNAMQDALSSVDEGYNVSAASALAQESRPVVESPYSMQSTDGVTYTLEEVTFTKNELQELRKQLIKEGAPEETLRQFDILADQPDGATLAQVIASLLSKKGNQFSEDDAHAITSLLSQIDPSGDLAADAISFMRGGNGAAALNLIQNALDKLPLDQSLDVDPDSMMALGRGLGLDNGSIQQIIGMMRGRSQSLNGAQFETLMQPAKAQFEIDAANAQKLDAALEKTLKPIISKARDRMEKEKLATERESRRVQQSKILIDRTVQRNSRETMDETLVGEAAVESGKAGGMIGKPGEARTEAAQSRNGEKLQTGKLVDGNEAGLAENAKSALNAHKNQEVKQDLPDARPDQDKKDQAGAWKDMLGRIETKPAATSPVSNASSVVYSMLQGDVDRQIAQMASNGDRNLPQVNQQIVQQVERGLLTAMRDGASRLDLQLHPAELGNIGITLIARNGEVTAQIRSERTETMEAIQRQMETIRVNLEQQGVKVDKIEVQLENQRDFAQGQFDDLGNHNARQEEETRRQELNRLKNLAALRNEDNSGMAQQLHNIGQTARYAGQALHVVA